MCLIVVNLRANIRLIMTIVIEKDKEWLREEIECGIQGFIEMNMESERDSPAKLVIEIDVPRPEECARAICGLEE